MLGFAEHLSVFPIEFHKFNNSVGRMQDSVYHLTLKSHFISDFCTKCQDVVLRKHDVFMNVNAQPYELICIFNP